MQIDIVSAAPSAAPTPESTGPVSEEAGGSESFAELLDAVADDWTEPEPEEGTAEEPSAVEWIIAPVLVPFIPVIPTQEVIEGQLPGVADVEAEDEGTSIDAVEGVAAVATVTASVTDPFETAGEPDDAATTQITQTPTDTPRARAGIESFAGLKDEEAVSVAPEATTAETAEVPASASAPEVESVAPAPSADTPSIDARTSESVKTLATALPVDEAPKVREVAENTTTPQAMASAASVEPSGAVADVQNTPTEDGESNRTSVTFDTPVETTPAHKGVAARLARALERAAEATAPHRVETPSSEHGQSFNQGADRQPSFGDWLREQLPQTVNPGAQAASPATFSIVAPVHHEAQVTAAIGSSETSLMPGGPVLPREHDVTMQIVQSLRLQFRDGIGEAVLKLKPEHLGSVAISLRVENGGLKANVQADMPAVRQWLESQQDTLRSALAEHGLRLDRFDVEPDGQRQASPEDPQERSPRKRQAQRAQQADQPVFEVVV